MVKGKSVENSRFHGFEFGSRYHQKNLVRQIWTTWCNKLKAIKVKWDQPRKKRRFEWANHILTEKNKLVSILPTLYVYKSVLPSLSLHSKCVLSVCVCIFLEKVNLQKAPFLNCGDIDLKKKKWKYNPRISPLSNLEGFKAQET